jgi:hypothetical protein|tara:strand:+ start:944 stop:1159 length:216 start_codon:yes stop_codon:yes gene_type:complete
MSAISHKSFSIKPGLIIAKEWDGVTDTNSDGQLTFEKDNVKNFEITPQHIVYYNQDGTPSVTVDGDGATLH